MERSPFNKLPPELRNIIWKTALKVDHVVICYNKHCFCFSRPDCSANILAMARTCKAAYKECSTILYNINVFAFCNPHGDVDRDIHRFLHSIGSTNAAAVARIRVKLLLSMNRICPFTLPPRLKSILAIKKKFCTSQRKMEPELRLDPARPYYEWMFLRIDLHQAKESWEDTFLELDSLREKLPMDRFALTYPFRLTFSQSLDTLKGVVEKMEHEW